MRLLGLMGPAGAGKDPVADTLVTLAPMDRRAFADALRIEISEAFGLDVRFLQERALREKPLMQLALRNCCDAEFADWATDLQGEPAVSPRRIMRRWGDWRRWQRPDYWLTRAEQARVAAIFDGHQAQLWTDVRYPNEADWVRSRGGMLWRIVRPGLEQDRSHDSETAADRIEADATILNAGSLDELRMRVVDLADALEGAE